MMYGKPKRDKLKNMNKRTELGITRIEENARKSLRWFGHVRNRPMSRVYQRKTS